MAANRRKRKKKEGDLHLTDKRHPITGILSTILGMVSLMFFAAACIFSGTHAGNAGIAVGLVGILCFVISIVGFILAWISVHQEDIRFVFPTLGSLLNGIQVVGYMVIYILGTYI